MKQSEKDLKFAKRSLIRLFAYTISFGLLIMLAWWNISLKLFVITFLIAFHIGILNEILIQLRKLNGEKLD